MSKRSPAYEYTLPAPVVPSPERLPLNDPNLPWARFEAFCRDLISRLPGTIRCNHYGKQGSKQRGIDLIAEQASGQKWVYQCKQYQTYNETQTQKAIDATTYNADKYCILVSCEIGTPVRDVCEAAGWDIWDVRDISQKVRELETYDAHSLIESHFGPMWRKAFLGLSGPALFTTPQEFFRLWSDPSRLFNHAWQLVGRQAHLGRIHTFVDDNSLRIAILTGRGGIGKTKVLNAFAREFPERHSELLLFFLEPSMPVTPEALEELPDRPCILVVDDAHRDVDSLGALFKFTYLRQAPVKLLLSTRPHAINTLSSKLREAGFEHHSILYIEELARLDREEVEALARQALGPEYAGYAEELTRATRDCPLVTVVAGRLLAERQVSPYLLANDKEFRYEVLTKFEEVEIGRIGGVLPPDICRELLRLIAAVSPFRDDNLAFLNASAGFLNMPLSQLREALGHLEGIGVLLRRGYTLRITPDVLSDHILYSACLTPQNRPTGYARRVFDTFGVICPSQVLRNVAELDWRQRRSDGAETNVLSEIWPDIERQFLEAPNSARCVILGLLEDVALYQPDRVLPFIEVAMRGPSKAPEDERLNRFHRYTHEDVLRKLPPLLIRIAFTPVFLSRSCDLLWQLGQDDVREKNPYPDHAIRLLQELAEYHPKKPLDVNLTVLEAATRWLQEPEAHNHRFSPLDVLDFLMHKEGDMTETRGHSLIMSPFLVNSETTRSLRDQVLQLIEICAQASPPHVALRAIQSLDYALAQPHGRMGMEVSSEILEGWVPEQLRILDMMQGIATRALDPLIQIKIAEAVRWEAHYATSQTVRDRAREIIQSVPISFDVRLTRNLIHINSQDWIPEDGEDFHEANLHNQQHNQQEREALATEFLTRYADTAAGARFLRERMAVIHAAKVDLNAEWFLHVLAQVDVQYSAHLCEAITWQPDDFLAPYLPCFLTAVRVFDIPRAVALAQDAAAMGDVRLCRSVAATYAQHGWSETTLSAEIDLLRSLAVHTDPLVRTHVITAARVLGMRQPEVAIDLVLAVDIGDDLNLADNLCSCFDRDWNLSIDNLTDVQIDTVLDKLIVIFDTNKYHVDRFLNEVARRRPRQVVQFFLRRVARAETLNDNHYHPLPSTYFQQPLDRLGESKEYVSLLRMTRDSIQEGTWRTRLWVPQLFQLVSTGNSPASLDVLSEWVDTGDAEKLILTACLVSKAPRGFVFTNTDFTVTLLRRAYEISEECSRYVGGYLFQSATSGGEMGLPGQPLPGQTGLRGMARQMMDRLQVGSPEFRFYASLEAHATSSIQDQLAFDEELEDK